jgi:lipopolysaccharide transport system ATP-binding protein
MDSAITVEKLGKRYRIGQRSTYKTFRDALVEWPRRLFRQPGSPAPDKNYIWALRDIDLEIKKGEVVGIIGRNGSGKSTLLKILSRITDPTEGAAWVRGRVGALLEVGTGFHPELTGRENIFISGAVLGMRREEILRKFDEIISFAGVEEFLDTPVKFYSSGMRVRLAFAVAAHLEPEILLVDEVLAVGDAAFQKKCIGRMSEVAGAGRTVLFVSHQMETIVGLCQRVIWLEGGRVQADLPAENGVRLYLQHLSHLATAPLDERSDRIIEGPLTLTRISLCDLNGTPVSAAIAGDPLLFRFDYKVADSQMLANVEVKAYINDGLGRRLFTLSNWLTGQTFNLSSGGAFICSIPRLPVRPGRYGVSYVVLINGVRSDKLYDAFYFDVQAGDFFGHGQKLANIGDFYCEHNWTLKVHSVE